MSYEEKPTIKEPEEIIKEVKLQHTGRQFTLPIPIDFIDNLELKKGDIFIFKIPLKDKQKYSIKLKEK